MEQTKIGEIKVIETKHQNGRLASLTYTLNGKRHGPHTEWRENGVVCREAHYVNDEMQGTFTEWNTNGVTEHRAEFRYGIPHGPASHFEAGQCWSAETIDGKVVSKHTSISREGSPAETEIIHVIYIQNDKYEVREELKHDILTICAYKNFNKHGVERKWYRGKLQHHVYWNNGVAVTGAIYTITDNKDWDCNHVYMITDNKDWDYVRIHEYVHLVTKSSPWSLEGRAVYHDGRLSASLVQNSENKVCSWIAVLNENTIQTYTEYWHDGDIFCRVVEQNGRIFNLESWTTGVVAGVHIKVKHGMQVLVGRYMYKNRGRKIDESAYQTHLKTSSAAIEWLLPELSLVVAQYAEAF